MPDHSDFKQAFLDLLDGRAPEPFPDGYITGEELGFYLKNQVPVYNPAQHPQYGKIRNPKLDKGDFVFVLPKEEAPPPPKERPTMATLTVTSTPSGADIYIDEVRIGKTPLQEHSIDTGRHRVKQVKVGLFLSGYQSRVVQLMLKGGQQVPWDVHLKKIPTHTDSAAPEGMVLIPAGEFLMGSDDRDAYDDQKPVHTVYLDAFYMDKYEVTNAQYKKFVDAKPQWRKGGLPHHYHNGDYLKHWSGNSYPPNKGNHPVVYVSWYSAMAYAQWAGKRLPTEAEWEKAARGGLVSKKYPWGDSIDASHVNYHVSYGGSTSDTTAVGSYASNGYGLHDMAGNVWEWCLDEYRSDFYKNSPSRNPVAGEDGIAYVINNFINTANPRVLRGGAWATFPENLRVADRYRNSPSYAYDDFGFRCVRAVSP